MENKTIKIFLNNVDLNVNYITYTFLYFIIFCILLQNHFPKSYYHVLQSF